MNHPAPNAADTIQTLREVYDNDEHLPIWEFGLTKAMLLDTSPKIRAKLAIEGRTRRLCAEQDSFDLSIR